MQKFVEFIVGLLAITTLILAITIMGQVRRNNNPQRQTDQNTKIIRYLLTKDGTKDTRIENWETRITPGYYTLEFADYKKGEALMRYRSHNPEENKGEKIYVLIKNIPSSVLDDWGYQNIREFK